MSSPLMPWLLALEEHSFYLFAVKFLATLCITTPSKFSSPDRELLLVMAQVCDGDLSDELGHVKVFCFSDAKSIYVASVIDHVRSICVCVCPCQMALPFIEHLAGSLSLRMIWTLSFSACDAFFSCVACLMHLLVFFLLLIDLDRMFPCL